MSTLHTIISCYNLSPVSSISHEIAGQLLKNIKTINELTVEKLAFMCNSSTATVNRQIKLITGLSFKQVKKELSDSLGEYPLSNNPMPENMGFAATPVGYTECLTHFLRKAQVTCSRKALDRICRMIDEADSISLYMQFALSIAKVQFQTDLATNGKTTLFTSQIDDWKQDLDYFTDKKLILATNSFYEIDFLYSEYLDLLKKASSNGYKILAISSSARPSLEKTADFQLMFEGTGTSMDQLIIDQIITFIKLTYRSEYM